MSSNIGIFQGSRLLYEIYCLNTHRIRASIFGIISNDLLAEYLIAEDQKLHVLAKIQRKDGF